MGIAFNAARQDLPIDSHQDSCKRESFSQKAKRDQAREREIKLRRVNRHMGLYPISMKFFLRAARALYNLYKSLRSRRATNLMNRLSMLRRRPKNAGVANAPHFRRGILIVRSRHVPRKRGSEQAHLLQQPETVFQV